MGGKTKEELVNEIETLRRESKGLKEELQSQRDRFNGVLSALDAGVDVVTQDFIIEYQNEFLVQRFGDRRGEKCYVVYMNLDKPCEHCDIHEAMKTGKTQCIELVGGDGRDYELRSSPFADIDGEVKVIEVVRDITERKQAEEEIQASLKEKELLLREIHHRVKNNMQVITSLLKLQSCTVKNKELLEAFQESRNRIQAMTLVHERLYQSQNLASIDFKEYVRVLSGELVRTYGAAARITLKIDIEHVLLDIDRAVTCGLIINEMVSKGALYWRIAA